MHKTRIKNFQKTIETPTLIESPVDLYYLTGQDFSVGQLLVSKSDAALYVDGRYFEKAKKQAICSVFLIEEFSKVKENTICFDSAFVSFDAFQKREKNFPHIKWIPNPNPLQALRAIKDDFEIKKLKEARDLTELGIKKVAECFKEGVSEEELKLEFELFCRKNGAMGLSFDPIIAFGENSAYPHHRAGKSRLKMGQVVLVDAGAVVEHYSGDLTRIFYFGTPDPRVQRLEKIVQRAKDAATKEAKIGVKIGKLDAIVREIFEKEDVKPLYTHNLGHGVGLETHEFPRLRFDGVDKDVVLEKNMVITIEPGLYMPGVGGVRLEDMVFIDA